MSPRYLLVIGENIRRRGDLLHSLADRSALTLSFSTDRIAALVNESCGCIPIARSGCVLGYLFQRHGAAQPIQTVGAPDAVAISRSAGKALLSRFWGGYVAAIEEETFVRVLRDPSGNFPAYHCRSAGLCAFASDAEILVKCGFAHVSIDLEEIGRQLYRAFVPAAATALHPIRELLAGFALHVPSDSEALQPCWSPWDHVAGRGGEPADAVRLARTVRHCVQTWGSTRPAVLLGISGGLDSSIVAACLSNTATETVCLTMYTDDPAGDERPFARALCDRLGLPLIERAYRLDDIDIGEALAANLPRPKDRTQANAYERVHRAVARELGVDTLVTGNGGDHVFGYSQSAAPIADRYLREGPGRRMFASLVDVCRQTGCSMTDALGQALRLVRQPPDYRVRPNPLFLDAAFVGSLGTDLLWHPWLAAPAGALPGKAAHIATILRVQPNLEPGGGTELAVLNPLVSQPVVETCLGVPSWEWRAGGRDRSLARRAFAHELPPLILDRRVKGSPGRFAARLLDHFRDSIRERLLGGRLAGHGILDCAGLERALAGDRPVPDLERVRILELVNAEAWIDHWTARPPEPSKVRAQMGWP